jgi:hypothetical protein
MRMLFVLALLAVTTATSSAEDTNATTPPTNVTVSSEDRLLRAFPQLKWSRAKLEFMFAQKAKIATALQAGGTIEQEGLNLAKETDKIFPNEQERKTFTDGWVMSGTIHGKDATFSKKASPLLGLPGFGELQLLYEEDRLVSVIFYTDGSDFDFSELYKMLVAACGADGRREVRSKNDSKIRWEVSGNTHSYDRACPNRAKPC